MDWELNRFKELTDIMEPYGDSVGERIDITAMNPDQVAQLILEKVRKYQNLELKTLDFAGRFIDWIFKGKKKVTTRLIAKESTDQQEGDLLLATDEENNLTFGVLKVTQIVEQSYANIDDQLAHVENYTDAESLKDELQLIYPLIEEESQIRVIYFDIIHMMDQKLQD